MQRFISSEMLLENLSMLAISFNFVLFEHLCEYVEYSSGYSGIERGKGKRFISGKGRRDETG